MVVAADGAMGGRSDCSPAISHLVILEETQAPSSDLSGRREPFFFPRSVSAVAVNPRRVRPLSPASPPLPN